MTKEITKAIILQQMGDKLKLREFSHAAFLFDETVVPVYNIEPHLEEWWQRYYSTSIIAIGGRLIKEVPDDRRWHLRAYDVVFMGAVTCTVAGIYIERVNRSPADAFIYLDLAAAQNVSYHTDLITPVTLNPGDKIYVNVDGFTSAQTMRLYIDYNVEFIR